MTKSLLFSSVVMIVELAFLYLLCIELQGSPIAYYIYRLIWFIPFSGGAIAAYMATSRKVKAGIIASVFSIVIVNVGGFIAESIGYGDAIGIVGRFVATILNYLPLIFSGLIGTAFGEWLSSR